MPKEEPKTVEDIVQEAGLELEIEAAVAVQTVDGEAQTDPMPDPEPEVIEEIKENFVPNPEMEEQIQVNMQRMGALEA